MNRIFRTVAAAALAVGLVSLVPGHAARAQDAAAKPAAAAKKLKALLVIGGCCHDYGRQKQILSQGISARAPVEFTVVHEGDGGTKHRHSVYEKADWWQGYDVVIHDECSADVTDVKFIENVLAAHKAGVPAVVLHCGMHNYRSEGFPKDTIWFRFTGLASTGHGPQEPIAINFVDGDSPITKGLEGWTTIKEELYNNLKVYDTAKPLARGKQVVKGRDGKERTEETVVAWTNTYEGKTKVFATTLGHNNETVADARYLNLVTRGMLWAAGKLDDEHFKASDANVDVKAIKADTWKPADKRAAADGAAGQELLTDAKCCGQQ